MAARFPARPPSELSAEERKAHETIEQACVSLFGESGEIFTWKNDQGALIGPFASFIYTPKYSSVFIQAVAHISKDLDIEPKIRELVIERVAAKNGWTKEEAVEITQGKKPAGLNEAEEIAFDIAIVLSKGGGPLEDQLFKKGIKALGREQYLAVAHFVAMYAYTCVVLNAAATPMPDNEKLF